MAEIYMKPRNVKALKLKKLDEKKRHVSDAPGTRITQNLNQAQRERTILIGIPTLGIIRMEWDVHRRGQTIPLNWSSGEVTAGHAPDSEVALGYSVADAQNVIVERAVMDGYKHLLIWEDDVLPPFDALLRLAVHIDKETAPIISGLYFSKGNPTWPLVFRGRGNGTFRNFALGEMVWCDGVPTGFLLVDCKILSYLWYHSKEYRLPDGRKLREVFKIPRTSWFDPEHDRYFAEMGTSDLHFCHRIITEKIFAKTGFHKFAKMRYPFVVDTNIFCQQIDLNGVMYPAHAEEVLLPIKTKASDARWHPITGPVLSKKQKAS